MEWYIKVLKNYAVFTGRAHRTEYWMFILFNFIVSFAIGFVAGLLGGARGNNQLAVFSNIYSLAILLPSIGVAIRRMHDINRSGWWILVPLYSIFLLARKGDEGDNQYGPDPWRKV